MTLTAEQIEIMQEDLCQELITLLMKNKRLTVDKALETLYNSKTFSLLENHNTGLYYQSSGYVYSYLNEELTPKNVSPKT